MRDNTKCGCGGVLTVNGVKCDDCLSEGGDSPSLWFLAHYITVVGLDGHEVRTLAAGRTHSGLPTDHKSAS